MGPEEPPKAQESQPARMAPAAEQFRRASIHPLRTFASQEPVVVEEKPQQIQVVGPNLPAQEAVVAQSAVEVLDDGTDLSIPAKSVESRQSCADAT